MKMRRTDSDYFDLAGDASLHAWLDNFDVVREAHEAAQKTM